MVWARPRIAAALARPRVIEQERLRALFPDIEPIGLRDGLQRTVDWFIRPQRFVAAR